MHRPPITGERAAHQIPTNYLEKIAYLSFLDSVLDSRNPLCKLYAILGFSLQSGIRFAVEYH